MNTDNSSDIINKLPWNTRSRDNLDLQRAKEILDKNHYGLNEIKERIFNKIISVKENLLHFFERLAGRLEYKLRVGDYRIIAEIDSSANKIEVIMIGHRKNIYQNLD